MKKLTKYFITLLAFIIVAQPLSAITSHYQSSNLSAKDTIDISADKVTIEASKNSNNRDYQKDHANVAIDISLTGGDTAYSADLDTTTNNSSGDTYNNSHIDASNIKISSIKDTNIKGATLKAKESAKLNVGGNLNIESLQDTKESSTINLSAGVSAGGENGAGGKLVLGSNIYGFMAGQVTGRIIDKINPLSKQEHRELDFSKKIITIDKIINPTIDIKGYLNVLE